MADSTPTPTPIGEVAVPFESRSRDASVTEASHGAGFIRGRLVDDFMTLPEAQIVWDEQSAATGRTKSTAHCYM